MGRRKEKNTFTFTMLTFTSMVILTEEKQLQLGSGTLLCSLNCKMRQGMMKMGLNTLLIILRSHSKDDLPFSVRVPEKVGGKWT